MRAIVTIGVAAALASGVQAQFKTGFENPPYAGSSGGTLLTNGFGGGGQDGWFNPVAGSDDHRVYTYAGNTPGFVQNPTGGAQFDVGRFGATHARAQHNLDFSQHDVWTVSYDIATIFQAGAAPVNNISSFSLQDSVTSKSYIALNPFNANGSGWNMGYNVYNAAGVAQATQFANASWMDLAFNHWYRQSTTFSFLTNEILEISIMDVHTGSVIDTVNPAGWYLQGGAASTLPRPTMFRLFNSGNAANIGGWDNLSIVPAPASVIALAGGLLAASRRRRA